MKIIAQNCPKLEHLNVSWCNNIDTRGLKKVVECCHNLKDLRAGEIRGWDNLDFVQDVFSRNTLERLILMNCDTLTDASLAVLMEGRGSDIDYISGRPVVPPRKLKHLDLTRCKNITDEGVSTMVNNIPEIEGLQLSKCQGIVDANMSELLPTTPNLTHLDLEELGDLTNVTLQALASSPCAKRMRHLSISYCENMGDTGMLPVLKACTNLRSIEMDNTRVGDLVLAEAAAMVRRRTGRTTVQGSVTGGETLFRPKIGLRVVAYDCQNVTWTGVREILSRNADVSVTTHTVQLPPIEQATAEPPTTSADAALSQPRVQVVRSTAMPTEVIQLKCFYTYQPTVEEHFKRVMRGDFIAARRLERKWAEFMMAQEEAGINGGGRRRRERRARQAQLMHADEEDAHVPGAGVGGGRRRRARSGGCAVM
jgi:F-box/leucine-rich repeat protein 2/20